MTGLWSGIALLTALAIAFVFWPLLRARRLQQTGGQVDRQRQNIEIFRERVSELEAELDSGSLQQEEFEQLKLELERNLLQDAQSVAAPRRRLQINKGTVVTVTLLAALVPVLAFGLYAKFGRAPDLELALNAQTLQGGDQARTLENALAMLESELKQRPENPEGWYMLATTYIGMERYAEGLDAFRKVMELLPQEAPQYAGVLGQYAQAMFFANGGKMDAEIRAVIERTLAIEPYEITVLGLLGIDAFEQQNYQSAIDYWSKGLINADGQAAESLRSGIASAAEKLKAQGVAVGEIAALKPASIRVAVEISDTLAAQLKPEQTLFVFARPVGGRMPLAAKRIQVSDLPQEIVLDDSLAMSPQARLSLQDEVEVTARVSLSGQPQASSGDLFGTLSPVPVRNDGRAYALVIDQVVE
jgi:cytochrome c-type biogenesis protein CcmH